MNLFSIPINNDAAKIDDRFTNDFVPDFKLLDLPVNNAHKANVPPK